MNSEIALVIYGIACVSGGIFIGKYWGTHHSSVLAIIHKELEVLETKVTGSITKISESLNRHKLSNHSIDTFTIDSFNKVIDRINTLEKKVSDKPDPQVDKCNKLTQGTINPTNNGNK